MKKNINTFFKKITFSLVAIFLFAGLNPLSAQNPIPINCNGGPSSTGDSHIRSVSLVGENNSSIDYKLIFQYNDSLNILHEITLTPLVNFSEKAHRTN